MNINRFRIDNGIARLETRYGMILIDHEDLHFFLLGDLDIKSSGYIRIRNTIKGFREFVHRLITSAPEGTHVDHINHNPLDNRRCNLRVCSRSENARNNKGHSTRRTSQYKGVVYSSRGMRFGKPWRAYTTVNGKRLWFGYHSTEEEAAVAYNNNAERLFNEFACLNTVNKGALVGSPTGNPPKP